MLKVYLPRALGVPHGLTHVVMTRGGTTVYVSGQTAVDAHGEIVGKNDLRLQTEQAYENLKAALAAVGATLADAVNVNIYVLHLKPHDLNLIREVRSQYYAQGYSPAST